MNGILQFMEKVMKKKNMLWLPTLTLAALLSGCQKNAPAPANQEQTPDSDTVNLTVWGGEEDEELLLQIIDGFLAKYQGQANFAITYEPQSESSCTDALMADLEHGADVFAFADDQLNTLVAAGALEPVENAETIKGANLPEAVASASVGDTLYALPLTADNGYFLYYNKKYFSENDIQSLDRMLEIAAQHDKKVSMEWDSGWYVYSLFGNTGLTVGLNPDGITNYCTWNKTEGEIRGIDVAQSMLRIAGSPGFSNRTDEAFLDGVKNGSVAAGVSGVWNAVEIMEAWGENTGAARLPTYTCNGSQVQMASFSGCKLIGVNAYSEHPEWAVRLAEWITNEENQQLRFEVRGQGPSNIAVADSNEIQQFPAIAALLEQSEFSHLQRVGGKFWDPVTKFAESMAAGNPSGQDIQEQLDEMAENVSAR